MKIRLNLCITDVSVLMAHLQIGIRRAREELRIELIGPGMLLPDTTLVLFDILRKCLPTATNQMIPEFTSAKWADARSSKLPKAA